MIGTVNAAERRHARTIDFNPHCFSLPLHPLHLHRLGRPPYACNPAPTPPCCFRIILSDLFDRLYPYRPTSCRSPSPPKPLPYPNATVPHPHIHLNAASQWRDRSMRVILLGCFPMAPLKKSQPDAMSSPPRASLVRQNIF